MHCNASADWQATLCLSCIVSSKLVRQPGMLLEPAGELRSQGSQSLWKTSIASSISCMLSVLSQASVLLELTADPFGNLEARRYAYLHEL